MKNTSKTDIYFNKLKSLLEEGMLTLGPRYIFQLANGDYEIYNKYRIHKESAHYLVHRHRDEQDFRFNKLRNAVTWCIYNTRDDIAGSNRIVELDRQQTATDIEIQQHKRMLGTCSPELYPIYVTKLQENLVKQKQIQTKLDKYITTARQWQLKETENATKRNEHK
jgi:hypothetical protein